MYRASAEFCEPYHDKTTILSTPFLEHGKLAISILRDISKLEETKIFDVDGLAMARDVPVLTFPRKLY